MLRYIRIFIASWRFWLIRMLGFRAEALLWSINSIIWIAVMLFAVELLFGQVNSIAGWTKNEVMILVSTELLFIRVMWWFVFPSLLNITGDIPKGMVDKYLLMPGSSRFFVSISKFEFDNYLPVFVLIFIIRQMIIKFGGVSVVSVVEYSLLIVAGLITFYCIFFMFMTMTFWFTRVFGMEDLFDSVLSIAKYPIQIFDKGMRFVFMYILPVAFVATFPVSVLIGKAGFETVIVGLIIMIIFVFLSQWFWNFALKHYSSASS